ncbi:MAG: hypothetical protein IJ270_04900, partial [Paludibacteraceae bacterium]|nr:hypothetical protein [Paludibacteraceae bacterium]
MKKLLMLVALGLLAVNAFTQVVPPVPANNVRYYFKNTSSVNAKSYTDDEIFINVMYPMTGMYGYFDGRIKNWNSIDNAPYYTWPNGRTERNFNAALSELPVDNTGKHYIDMPPSPAGGPRIYVAFGQPLFRPSPNNPLVDAPEDPNYMIKVETIEFYIGGDGGIFTNTSRVDRYAYPMGEELYCGNGTYYDKVGETVSHEMVIQKWKRFVHDAFQYSYDPIRDVINAPKGTDYLRAGRPGEHYMDDFINSFFEYYRTHTLRARWNGNLHTARVVGNNLVWDPDVQYPTQTVYPREAFDNCLLNTNPVWDPGHGMCFRASLFRGAVLLTEEEQVWDNPDNFWKNEICSDYMAFWHSDLVSYDSKTYAYDYDDVFEQSSTQNCARPDSVVLSLGGFGVEHVQELDKVYITPLEGEAEVSQYAFLQLTANGIDTHDLDMPIPDDAVITWTVRDPGGAAVNNLIDATGVFGPATVAGDYEVTLTVVSGGKTMTNTRIVTVKDPMDVAQVCTGPVGTDYQYQLEIVGTKAYLTLIPNNPANLDSKIFYYGKVDILNTMGANTITPNVPYPLNDVFFGDHLYMYLPGGKVEIPRVGTCEGLTILEDVIALFADNHTMKVSDAPYTINVNAITNYRTTQFPMPDASGICTEPLTFSGTGVNPTTGVFTPTAPGDYVITITYPAVKGNVTRNITITVNSDECTAPDLSIPTPETLTCSNTNVQLSANATNVTYSWNTGETDAIVSVDMPGIYSVTVTDNVEGCTASATVSVAQNTTSPTVTISNPETLTCIATTVQLSANATDVSYLWSTGLNVANISVSNSGAYSVTVTDNVNGCTASATTNVAQNITTPTVTISNPETLTCIAT